MKAICSSPNSCTKLSKYNLYLKSSLCNEGATSRAHPEAIYLNVPSRNKKHISSFHHTKNSFSAASNSSNKFSMQSVIPKSPSNFQCCSSPKSSMLSKKKSDAMFDILMKTDLTLGISDIMALSVARDKVVL